MRSLKDRQRQDDLAEADDRDLVSRSDKRKDRNDSENALKELALSLVDLKPKNLKRVELPEYVRESIVKAKSFPSPKARNRQVLVVRQHLRELDSEALQDQVTDILFPPIHRRPEPSPDAVVDASEPATAETSEPAAAETEPVEPAPPMDKPARVADWELRLGSQGDAALALLVEEYPHANRQLLRQQLRVVRKKLAPEDTAALKLQKRAELKLRQVLNSLVK